MELDVHLTRQTTEPWGFELFGGCDQAIPLTIDMVDPSSPAHLAGLHAGDIVTRVGDQLATSLSQEDAQRLVSSAVCTLAFGLIRYVLRELKRGLYDPVLDDFEAIYEPTERADSDLRSEPTEVPLRCIDYPEHPLSELKDFCPITQPRSLTASPFLPLTKPYRPFSTEPLLIPPLDDPIILNPEFKDEFGDILADIDIDNVETKFKLPVSEKYDPNYKKKVDGILEKSMEREVNKVSEIEMRQKIQNEEINDRRVIKEAHRDEMHVMNEEIRFEEEMKLEIDMENIEKTALDVVEESIERAVSVTEEIQKEVEIELRASTTRDIKQEKIEEFCESRESVTKTEMVSDTVKSKDEVIGDLKADVAEFRSEERSEVKPEPKELLYVRENKHKIKTHEVNTEMNECQRKNYDTNETKEEGNQNAFMIGLQTIPNIKGMAQSSHYFDLLLRTFFIHLTDVMVALSRFILTQPAFELETKAERVIRDQLITGLAREDNRDTESKEYKEQRTMKTDVKIQQESTRAEKREVEIQKSQKSQELQNQSEFQEHHDVEENERKILSGAQMAQMTQRKPKDLTYKMDAVISEFETKTGIEERLEVNGQRSRSRSRIEEEVKKETDPLEWLDKADRQSETTNLSNSKKSFSKHTESKETRKLERESTEIRTSKTKPGKQMYVAIVEAHTYPNKDAILEEQIAEMSETASIESTEEMNTAFEQKQQAVEVITQALDVSESTIASESKHLIDVKESRIEKATVSTEESYKMAAVESAEVNLEACKELTEIKVNELVAVAKQELLTSVASETTETVEDMKVKAFEVTEVSDKKAVVTLEENYKATAVHSFETVLEESTEKNTELKISKKQATTKVEQLAIAVAESTDIVIDESKVEIFETEQLKSKTAVITSEESFKTAAIETTEVVLEEAVEEHDLSVETGHATIRESKNLAVAGIIETKTEQDKVVVPEAEDEYASLKIMKQEVVESNGVDITEISVSEVNKSIEIENYTQETTEISKKLHLRTDMELIKLSKSSSDENNNINTPTPSTIPPTPLTDEYMFKLQIPLPKNIEKVIIDDSTDHEDLSIVKKKLIPHIETYIEEQVIYDPPLPTPTDDMPLPVYTKAGLKGGAAISCQKKEYIREIERKSSLLASAIDETIRSIEEYKEDMGIPTEEEELIPEDDGELESADELPGFRHIKFQPELAPSLPRLETPVNIPAADPPKPYVDGSGAPLGSVQGIIDALDDATVDEEVAKELGKPGLTEDKIAELISGESEMLREAHVMGLARVLSSHMTKPDDSSVDFNKIKPLVDSLKNSEVLRALNEEILKRGEEEKKKDERKWTTFLQKPVRSAPRTKGCYGFLPQEADEQGPYKVKIVKQPKPKVAPDYKPEDFETGPLPWEQRALTEPPPDPVTLEDPILIPEDTPQFLEALDSLPESEVPDLEDTGIELPPPPVTPEPPIELIPPEEPVESVPPEEEPVEQVELGEPAEMNGNVEEMAEQLVQNVKNMVDPHAPIQHQLAQMRAQLDALAQLPSVIQHSLEILTGHLANITQQETLQACASKKKTECIEQVELSCGETVAATACEEGSHVTAEEIGADQIVIQEEPQDSKITLTEEEYVALKREEEMLLEEQRKSEQLKKVQEKIDRESRQIKQRSCPRVGKPTPAFGPLNPEVRPQVLPGGRRWKTPKDAFNDQFIAETIQSQSEIIQGKVMGINFMKWEKPPVNLDHLQNSDVYRAVHGQDQTPLRRVDLLTPVVAEADYREQCRSMTPLPRRVEEHLDMPQQLQP